MSGALRSRFPRSPLRVHTLLCTWPQAYGFYDDINKVLDFYIGLVPPETKAAAEKLVPAKRAPLPKFLFKEDAAIMREKVAIS